MKLEDLKYCLLRLKEDPKRLFKIVTSRNVRGILLNLPFEPGEFEFLNNLTSLNKKQFGLYQEEINNNGLTQELRKRYFKVRGRKLLSFQKWHELIYIIIRHTKPNLVVETGVFDGLSSAFILQALAQNKQGQLISIDLPATRISIGSTNEMLLTSLPKGKSPGWIVPDNLRNRWQLLLGSSKKHLPSLIKKEKDIDIFIHDSLHTYDYMIWEYEVVWNNLRKGGLLCSDDIFVCNAFQDFSKKVKKKFYQKTAFGALIK